MEQNKELAQMNEQELRVDIQGLAEENASFANYLGDCGYTKADIDLIAEGERIGWHGSIAHRLVESERQEIRIKDLEASLKDRERRLDSIMGLANDCNFEEER